MKKPPNFTKIEAIVRNGDIFRARVVGTKYVNYGNGVEYDGNRWSVSKNFPNTPAPPYRLTLTLNTRGKLRVRKINGFPAIYNPVRKNFGLVCCFMPDEWIGQRISRKVVAIR